MKHKTKQIIIPFYKVPKRLLQPKEIKKQIKERAWREFKIKGKTEGFWSPFYGSNRHTAVVEAKVGKNGEIIKIKKFLFDQMERTDGPIQEPFGHSTPNAMVVVLEETKDRRLLVHSVKEWRPFIYDHRKNKKGVFVTGVTGKWAKNIGDHPLKTALQGLLEDTGIEVEESKVIKIGMHTPNRAWVETCNEVYAAVFKRKVQIIDSKLNALDIVKEGKVYFLDEFPLGPDALVNSALWMVARYFRKLKES